MIADLDTLLTALYVELTDRIIPSLGLGRSGPGKPPEVTTGCALRPPASGTCSLACCGKASTTSG